MTITDRRRALMGAQRKKSPRLPSAYQEVEWIGGNKQGWIVTNYTPNYNDDISFEFILDGLPSSYMHPISAGSTGAEIILQITKTSYQYWKWFSSSATQVTMTVSTNTKYDCVVSRGKLKFNGVTISPQTNSGNPDSVLYLMTRKSNTSQMLNGRFYGLTAKRDETVVFTAIPCYRKADGKIGVYDIVSDTFFGNSGTGTFSKGADV